MSIQIAVRLPDELADFVDEQVAAGNASSRAAVVSGALERERRRQLALHDIAILSQAEPDADLDDLARFSASQSLPLD